MKRLITILAVALFAVAGTMAQNTREVRGAVIDRNGNPLPGAEVSATGGAETTMTDADGTFTLEVPIWLKSLTARYSGMADKKVKTDFNGNMIFTMKPEFRSSWFINAIGGFDVDEMSGIFGGRVGLMGGKLAKWGYYGKLTMATGGAYIENSISGTVGVIRHVYQPMFAYLGAGVGGSMEESDYYYYYDDEWCTNAAVEAGFIFRFNHFNFSLGYTITFGGEYNHSALFGLGYCF